MRSSTYSCNRHRRARRARTAISIGLVALTAVVPALNAQVAGAASPPTAYTGGATQPTFSSATLKGTVYPGNQQSDYYFQYGQTSAYEAQTPVTPAGGGAKSIQVTAPIAGLLAGTTYHYRLVVANPSGTVEGQDRTFTTKRIPLTVALSATRVRTPFGSPLSLAGTLSGTGSANHTVVLQANPFPFLSGFKPVTAPELTDADGHFSFSLAGLAKTTQLRVTTLDTPLARSRVVVALVAVRVTLHVRSVGRRGYARLYGTVAPAQPGETVRLQFLRPHEHVANVGSVFLTGRSAASRFSRVVRIRRAGLYRAFVQVVSGAQVSNHSRPVRIG